MCSTIDNITALKNIFERVVNNYYKKGISVFLVEDDETAYCTGNKITLPLTLLEEFTAQKLPRFTVLYHELGHALYSDQLTLLLNKWKNLPVNNLQYMNKYHYLLNWIEDYYIESKLVQDYPFLFDLLNCLKHLNLPYDINALDKAFNYYYIRGHASGALTPADAVHFTATINKLLKLRDVSTFGNGPISILSNKSNESQFIKLIIDFFKWCVSKGILTDSVQQPLQNPNQILGGNTIGDPSSPSDSASDNSDNSGSSSEHSHIVGEAPTLPKYDLGDVKMLSDKFVAENKLIKQEILKQSKVDLREQSIEGLFNSMFQPSSIIQSKVIVPNFFNPNRLLDQVLFKAPKKSFNNVSVYRDISGSTHGSDFKLINSICEYLNKQIPIAYNFYLYASGDISILQTDFISWEDHRDVPELYDNNTIFQQFNGGTNSDAIADVISTQLNDKWLNIIVTDGDLNALMQRDNINTLLENVFVISIASTKCPNAIIIKDESEINNIASLMVERFMV